MPILKLTPIIIFLSIKSKIYREDKRIQMYTGREQKGAKTKTSKKKPQTPYLLPIQVRKSRTECALALLYILAHVHKLDTKLALILWAEGTSFSNTNLFLPRQRFQNRHKRAANQKKFSFLAHNNSLPS